MGPAAKSVAPPPRRCLLCRRDAQRSNAKLKSCAISLCTIFGLPDTHPFRVIYERAQYCDACLKELQQADVLLGKLELMKQSLLRFQNRVYSKLGDNYFQIDGREQLTASFLDFEEDGGAGIRGRKFSYDEIVKVLYEKLDKDCLKWERFSSNEGNVSSTSTPSKVDTSTQTEIFVVPEAKASAGPSIIIPLNDNPVAGAGDDDWHCDEDDMGGGGGDDNDGGGSVFEVTIASTSLATSDPLTATFTANTDLSPAAKGLPFTRAPINFDAKIYCTVDPDKCKRFFYDDYNLQVHIKSFHQGNPLPHECTVCNKGFVDECRLKNHFLRVHTSHAPQTFICEHCGRPFSSPAILREHVRKKHTENPRDANYPCAFCSAPFSSPEEHLAHESLHRSKEHPFACVLCPQVTPNSTALKAHFSQSHSEHHFTCDQCGKHLASEASLKTHQVLHTGTFQCDQCGFTGTSKNALKQHQLTHSSEKPFTCEVCGIPFKYSKNLASHMRIHTGVKPYTCSLCGQSFRELSYLRRHEESHSAVANYECPDCGQKFKVKENMKKHQRTHKEGYVPKKKAYRPRTEEQKETRRLKRLMKKEGVEDVEELREELRVKPEPKRRKKSAGGVRSSKSAGGRKTKKKVKVIKAKAKKVAGRKKKKSLEGNVKVGRGRKKKGTVEVVMTKRELEEEEDSGEDYPMEEPDDEEMEEAMSYTELERLGKREQTEVESAVQSIQDTVEAGGELFGGGTGTTTVVYQQAGSFQGTVGGGGQATFIPVTVVNTQGVRTASQLVVRARAQQQQTQQQIQTPVVTQYQFL